MPLSCEAIQDIPPARPGDFDSMGDTSIQQSAGSGCQTSLVMANINEQVQDGQSYADTTDNIPNPLQSGGKIKRQTRKRRKVKNKKNNKKSRRYKNKISKKTSRKVNKNKQNKTKRYKK